MKVKDSDRFNKVVFTHDKTRKELKEDRELKDKLKEVRESTGEDYIIYRKEIILRGKKPANGPEGAVGVE